MYIERKCWEGSLTFTTDDDDDDDFDEFQRFEAILSSFFGEKTSPFGLRSWKSPPSRLRTETNARTFTCCQGR